MTEQAKTEHVTSEPGWHLISVLFTADISSEIPRESLGNRGS